MEKLFLKFMWQIYFFLWHSYTKKIKERKEKEIHSNANDKVFFFHLKIELNSPVAILNGKISWRVFPTFYFTGNTLTFFLQKEVKKYKIMREKTISVSICSKISNVNYFSCLFTRKKISRKLMGFGLTIKLFFFSFCKIF